MCGGVRFQHLVLPTVITVGSILNRMEASPTVTEQLQLGLQVRPSCLCFHIFPSERFLEFHSPFCKSFIYSILEMHEYIPESASPKDYTE